MNKKSELQLLRDALEDRYEFLRNKPSDGGNPTIIDTAILRSIREIIHGIYSARNEPWDHIQ